MIKAIVEQLKGGQLRKEAAIFGESGPKVKPI